MSVMAVVGAQWGDEGKGKLIDELSARADYVVRYQGGGNAGHRVVYGDTEFAFHLVPAGILHPNVACVIGNGVVVDPRGLLAEMESLGQLGVDMSKLYISERAHVVMPYHAVLDRLEEESRGVEKIGTVLRGIGPAYVDKYSRVGIRMADLLDVDQFRAKLATVLAQKNRMITQIYNQQPLSLEEIHTEYVGYAQRLRPYITDTEARLHKAMTSGASILLEGAQGALLDVDFGTYPFVTSSSTVAGNASTGAGLPPRSIQHVLGVYKAYITRVGSGPMPTELFEGEGKALRDAGHEYGTTTGRARRCGWFDAVVGRFVARLNGFDSVAIMKLDVLDGFSTVKICTSYKLGDRELTTPPANTSELAACEPVYEEWPGWMTSTVGVTRWEDLPAKAQRYLQRVEELLETPLALISTGPGRGETIHRRELAL
ncbi:MAG: Adenylosuccinate synthetase [Ktedonobacterales bacterium]|jgi:adenylosuccinate synthase|nr:MAG: Adenylosuccinate synthetase [Ktedonobacterales bacterium]